MASKRIVVTLSQDEYDLVEKESRREGFRVSAFAKYRLLQGILPQKTNQLSSLFVEMQNSLDSLKSGQTFIVSSLFEPSVWRSLVRGEKNSLAQRLKDIVNSNPNKYIRTKQQMPDKTRIYLKK